MDYSNVSILERIRQAFIADGRKMPAIENATEAKGLPRELSMSWEELREKNPIKEIKKDNYTLYAIKDFEKYGSYPDDFREKADFPTRVLYEKSEMAYQIYLMDRLTYDELQKFMLLPTYKKLNAEGYKQKYFDKYKVAPQL